MPSIIEYDQVLRQMQALKMQCLYYNSGAFGFERDVPTQFRGWIGAEDSTIRPEARKQARIIAPPIERTLARMAARAWQEFLPGPLWLMPKSQWAYELDFGSRAWLPDALRKAGVEPSSLAGRTDSPAIEFNPDEADRFTLLAETLLEMLLGSDFALTFPGHPVVCTLHHHKQIWWISSDPEFMRQIDSLRDDPSQVTVP